MSTLTRTPATIDRNPKSLTHPARTGFLLTLPALAFVTVFVLVPLAFAVYMSLTNWPLIGSYRFIGLGNYTAIASDPVFWKSVGYTLLYTAIVTVPILVLGYVLAVVVRSDRRFATVFRTIFFVPYVVGLTTLSFLMVLEAQPSSGMVNVVLKTLGITDGTTAWLADGPAATGLICGMIVWAVSGLTMVLLMGGMQGIPRDVYESAEMDGASWWQRERSITVPMLRRTIAMSLVISVIGSLLAFTQFYVLTRGGPGTDTQTVVMYVYQRGFVQLQLGAASALSIVLVVVIGLVTAAQFRLLREKE
ncbi:carbohydrate ABC transporter permease [Kineococcus rhizosphaerae]|uniref:Carbohydrate ABC transporter membrane protein 1 (CUT1 family) n=1 Tax=Kineococcus rhizosphaerae TaxID=559628 RepID=A0A2T0R6H4_9ACTN|nr:sugar ABC transporter permease [Kineococcus rhizosphaerae]PRY16762.1 carbohydrate ABC transporter membrane protein 1 (CUT1 family) [Kineococcus rhizosphaerae]